MHESAKRVYHASSVQGLTCIEPRPGTHGEWVYATDDPVMAALFLAEEGFLRGMTPWEEEVVGADPVVPVAEIEVRDVAGYLRGLARRGERIISWVG